MQIKVGVSKRHVHLTKEVWEILFGNSKLELRNPLNQPGEFASTSTVDIKWNDKVIPHVRVVGPLRDYNQIEIDEDDAKFLMVSPPRRQSGELDDSLPITLIGPHGTVNLTGGLIFAERHIHIDEKMAEKEKLKNKQVVSLYKDKAFLFDALIKIKREAYFELHIDLEEAKRYNIEQNDILELVIDGDVYEVENRKH